MYLNHYLPSPPYHVLLPWRPRCSKQILSFYLFIQVVTTQGFTQNKNQGKGNIEVKKIFSVAIKIFVCKILLCMNVLLEVDDRKHVLLKQVLVLHLLRHFSEKTNLNTIDDDALNMVMLMY